MYTNLSGGKKATAGMTIGSGLLPPIAVLAVDLNSSSGGELQTLPRLEKKHRDVQNAARAAEMSASIEKKWTDKGRSLHAPTKCAKNRTKL